MLVSITAWETSFSASQKLTYMAFARPQTEICYVVYYSISQKNVFYNEYLLRARDNPEPFYQRPDMENILIPPPVSVPVSPKDFSAHPTF